MQRLPGICWMAAGKWAVSLQSDLCWALRGTSAPAKGRSSAPSGPQGWGLRDLSGDLPKCPLSHSMPFPVSFLLLAKHRQLPAAASPASSEPKRLF